MAWRGEARRFRGTRALVALLGPVALLVPLVAGGGRAGAAIPTYSYTDIGSLSLGGGISAVADMNERGEIVGSGITVSGVRHGFVWRSGTVTDLGGTNPGPSQAFDINDNGQVVGEDELSGSRHAVLWAVDGTVTDLGGDVRDAARRVNDAGQVLLAVPGGGARWQNGQRTPLGDVSLPTDLNEAGQVVGIGPGTPDNDFLGFLWDQGVTTVVDLLPPVGGRQAVNLDLNERGQVIGDQCSSVGGCRNGSVSFFWENGVTTAIPTLGGTRSDAVALNDAGQIVGWAATTLPLPAGPGQLAHAFLWQGGTMTDLGTLRAGDESFALAINNAGQVVGSSGDRAFLWQDGEMADITPPGASGAAARFISDRGSILISAVPDGGTDTHWYLATPAAPGTTTTTTQPSTTTTTQPSTTATTQPSTTTTSRPGDGPVYSCGGVSGTKRELRAAGYRVVIGTDRNDELEGSSGRDFMLGLRGRDEIESGSGDDVVCGGPGNDRVEGGRGNDALAGETGDDRLDGERGTDVCDGGPGRDEARSCETVAAVP